MQNRADTLFAASKILRRERDRVTASLRHRKARPFEILMLWTELMLTAFGIECLIKATWVKDGHQLARDGKHIPMTQNERHQQIAASYCHGELRFVMLGA